MSPRIASLDFFLHNYCIADDNRIHALEEKKEGLLRQKHINILRTVTVRQAFHKRYGKLLLLLIDTHVSIR